jgi:nitrogen-specific signal transduction histidine kinase
VYVETKAYPMKDEKGDIVSVIEVLVDVTEKTRLEEQLRQSQKMEAVGTLAGGVAHDFNNILTAILGYSEIVRRKMLSDDPQRPLLDQVLESSKRAANLTRGLLAFSRKQIIEPKPSDLNDIVRNMEKLLRHLIGEDIEFVTRLAAKELIAMVDPGQIEQVIMNLATNARDAMPAGGTLSLTTDEIDVNEDFAVAHGLAKAGRYALIAVSDTGTGMDEQTREKIFEPFFTTKEVGKGTGLGLAIVYGMVKQHNGHIDCYSEPGHGTTFKIYIPLIALEVHEVRSEEQALPRGGAETILLAEDDLVVRALLVSLLAGSGYRVIEADDGQKAIDQFALHSKEIDLVILDVVMPKKSGKEAYDNIKAARPDMETLFISGYTSDIIHTKGIYEKGLQFVSKPVSPPEFLGKVRELLDKKK